MTDRDELTEAMAAHRRARARNASARSVVSEEERTALARVLDRADDRFQHGVGASGYDPDGLPYWLADAVLAAGWRPLAGVRAGVEAVLADPYAEASTWTVSRIRAALEDR